MRRFRNSVVAMLAAGLVHAGAVAAQISPDSGAFITMLGSDTIGAERFTLTRRQLEVRAVTRVPQTRRLHLLVDIQDDGSVTSWSLLNDRPPGGGGPPPIRTLASYSGDSVRFEVTQGNTVRARTVLAATPPFSFPLISPIYASFQAALPALESPADSGLVFQSLQGPVGYVVSRAGDTVTLRNLQLGMLRLVVDDSGRLQHLSAAGTTFKVAVHRAPAVDIDALAADFAARDAAGHAIGQLSPRDTTRATVQGATVLVAYGRPAVRGRVIFGDLVPFGQVWRTGANAATELTTSRDLIIGESAIPAGSYSLWTVPDRERWTLIVNRETGQWGTDYHAEHDLVRIPIPIEQLPSPVERLTVVIQPGGLGGEIHISWDATRAVVPFRVR